LKQIKGLMTDMDEAWRRRFREHRINGAFVYRCFSTRQIWSTRREDSSDHVVSQERLTREEVERQFRDGVDLS
jgi:hypothetical protein